MSSSFGVTGLLSFDPSPFLCPKPPKKVAVRHRWLQSLRTRSGNGVRMTQLCTGQKIDIEPQNGVIWGIYPQMASNNGENQTQRMEWRYIQTKMGTARCYWVLYVLEDLWVGTWSFHRNFIAVHFPPGDPRWFHREAGHGCHSLGCTLW